jgi:hypothetical protein
MKAYDALPTRAEPFWQMSCIYRKHNRPRSAFIMAMHGLQIPLPQDNILFVDTGVYTWGILDEVATTAAHAGKYHLGLEATAKLLSEPYLPEDQRERVSNNRKLYLEAVTKFNMQVAEQQQKVLEKQQEAMKKIEDNSKKTTLGIDLSKTPVTL